MTISDFEEELLKLGLKLSNEQLNQLETYYNLIVEYNKVMNLTGITERDQVYLKHFYDSITIIKEIDLKKYNTFCDMGTGAGFPGMVIKIVFPHLNVTLLDSLNKRINFLNIVIDRLKLDNIKAIHTRIEEYGKTNREIFDVVASRAVAGTNILLEYATPMLKKDGYFICMKGTMDNESDYQNALRKLAMEEAKKIEFLLPFENSKRTIIYFKKINKTSKLFPRKYKEILANPL